MKKLFHLLLTLCVSSIFAEGYETIPTKLNVRVRASLDSSIACTLEKGDTVRIISDQNGWLEIPAPGKAQVWVHTMYLKHNTLKANAILRPRPGTAYFEYLYSPDKEQPVEILETTKAPWVRIKPPAGLTCFIKKEFVQMEPIKIVRKTDVKSTYIEGDEQLFSADGRLKKLSNAIFNATHCIVLEVNNKDYTICYVMADSLNLSLWEGQFVRVEGQSRWVSGKPVPFVSVTKITPNWK